MERDDIIAVSLLHRSAGLWSHSQPTRMRTETFLHEDLRFGGML